MAPTSLLLICLLFFTNFRHTQGLLDEVLSVLNTVDYVLQEITSYPDTFSTPKQMGAKCKNERHYCDHAASCNHGKCYCSEGEHSFGIFGCLKQDWIECRSVGDPHVQSFSRSRGRLNMPCTHKLTSYSIGSSYSYDSSCDATLYGTNIYRFGRFYGESVDGELTEKKAYYADRKLAFTASRNGVQLRFWNGDVTNIPWGSDYTLYIRDVQVAISFDTVQNYVLISAPECFLRVKLRPANLDQEQQDEVPGYAVATKKYYTFPHCSETEGHYPMSLCGTPADGTDLYDSRVSVNGVNDVETALLFDWLAHTDADQSTAELGTQCAVAIQAFDSCSDYDEAAALNLCGPIFNSSKLNKCFHENGISDPMTIFNNCLIGFCQQDSAACAASVSAMTACSAFGPPSIHDQNCTPGK